MWEFWKRRFGSEHQRVEALLSAYLDGEVSSQERALVERHLARCPECARNLETLSRTVSLLRELPRVATPRSFVLRPAQVERRFAPPRPAFVYLRAATALSAFLLVVLFVGDFFFMGMRGGFLGEARMPVPAARPVASPVREKGPPETVGMLDWAKATPPVKGAIPPTLPPEQALQTKTLKPRAEGEEEALTPTPRPIPSPTPTKEALARPLRGLTPTPSALPSLAMPQPPLRLSPLRLAEVAMATLTFLLAIATLLVGRR